VKAEQETILEEAEEIIRKVQENYAKDVIDFTGKIESSKITENENKSLRSAVESHKKEIEELSSQINKINEEVTKKQKELETIKENLQSQINIKLEEVSKVNRVLEETKKKHELELKETRIKSMCSVTGIELNENSLNKLMECKTDKELIEKIEDFRDGLAKQMLYSNIKEVKIAEHVPEKEVYIAGHRVNGNILDNVTAALQSMG